MLPDLIPAKPSRPLAIAEALVVLVIWASSYVLAKMAMAYGGPLTVSGLRYSLAGILVAPFTLARGRLRPRWSRESLVKLILMGVGSFAVGNGATFWGLQHITAATAQLITSLTPLPILLAGVVFLRELPAPRESAGTVLSVAGCVLFFSSSLSPEEWLGVGLTTIGAGGLVVFTVIGRQMARTREVDTAALTAVPLLAGGSLLMLAAVLVEGPPDLARRGWVIVFWMAAVNSAMATYLHNHALQTLKALEMNTLVNLSPLGTALLGWLVLDEGLELIQITGMVAAVIGVGLVQWRGRKSVSEAE